jgi:carboxyl-terminal processing protease
MEPTSRLSLLTQACLLVSILSGVLLGVAAFRHLNNTEPTAELYVGQALEQIRDHYVEEIDERKLAQSAIDGMLGHLDHYSILLDSVQLNQLQQNAEGKFGGVGIEVDRRDGNFVVIAPIADSPAYHAGIQAGDHLKTVNEQSTTDLDMHQLAELIKGKAGTEVELTLIREGLAEPLTMRIVRAQLAIESVNAQLLDNDLVYARLTKFQRSSAQELSSALARLGTEMPVRGLILDLRNNPGGLLSSAVAVADLFLQRGVIVTTRKRRGESGQQHFRATLDDILPERPIAVLINAGSASAAEVVAAALKDHQRGVLVGTRSFGKGSVQTIMPTLSLQQTIKLTTAEYFSPQGHAINEVGVIPDVSIEESGARTTQGLDPWLEAAIAELQKVNLGVE